MKKIIGALLVGILFGGYNFAGAALTDGLIAHYEFEGNANDSSGNGNNGIEYGGISYVPGKIGQSAWFDGVDNCINVGDKLDMGTNNFSVSLWVKQLDDTLPQNIISKGLVDTSLGWKIISRDADFDDSGGASNGVAFSIGDGSSSTWSLTKDKSVVLNDWHHIVVVFDRNSQGCLYKDTNLVQCVDISGIGNINNSDDFLIGLHPGISRYFHGNLDDLRIYNKVLTTSEITELSTTGATTVKNNPQHDTIESNWLSFKNDAISVTGEVILFAANAMLVAGHIIIPQEQPLLMHWAEGLVGGSLVGGGIGGVTSASPSYFWMEGTLSTKVTGLSFDAVGVNLSGNDYIACFVNSELRYAYPASQITNDTWFNSGFIDLSEYQDKSANIAIGIFTSEANRAAYFKNLTFYKSNAFPWTMFLPAITGSSK